MRTFVKLVVVMAVLLAVTLVPYGCSTTDQSTPWTQAGGHADTIAGKLDSAATQVSGSGQDIIATATAGQAATPAEIRPRLDPFWLRLIASGHALLGQGDALAAVRRDVDALRAEVKAGQEQLKTRWPRWRPRRKGGRRTTRHGKPSSPRPTAGGRRCSAPSAGWPSRRLAYR